MDLCYLHSLPKPLRAVFVVFFFFSNPLCHPKHIQIKHFQTTTKGHILITAHSEGTRLIKGFFYCILPTCMKLSFVLKFRNGLSFHLAYAKFTVYSENRMDKGRYHSNLLMAHQRQPMNTRKTIKETYVIRTH